MKLKKYLIITFIIRIHDVRNILINMSKLRSYLFNVIKNKTIRYSLYTLHIKSCEL